MIYFKPKNQEEVDWFWELMRDFSILEFLHSSHHNSLNNCEVYFNYISRRYEAYQGQVVDEDSIEVSKEDFKATLQLMLT